ncbi:hypothetical protein MetMK1DRAFT_00012010 [Metallosphaera yellowstonensis MK1]|jgi:uncharacterized membrane protein|uniref:Uncharacterized protein n=1 Tax=Metallosphaera yellowstonensis MK1 TaxID=671065 RepID=H2C377_9CREN|nr:hypothetical protein [Metallosphaera yellowstonensis]EHP70698.1 hypothetical protein MetMK1DRAFT_00012010 [Metallosphaera yellowstonensis MK1]
MKDWEVAGISLLLILLPVIPALVESFLAFAVASTVGFVIVSYLLMSYKPWESRTNSIISLYFSGVFSFGLAFGVFLALPLHSRLYGLVALIESIPFLVSFYFATRGVWKTVLSKEVLSLGDGYLALVLVVLIGAIVGRFLHNFYELVILYSGFLTMGFLALLYFRK